MFAEHGFSFSGQLSGTHCPPNFTTSRIAALLDITIKLTFYISLFKSTVLIMFLFVYVIEGLYYNRVLSVTGVL